MNSGPINYKENGATQHGIQSNQSIIDAMNKWSGSFFKLLLPSNLGSKATFKQVTHENAKVLSMGVYMGQRTAVPDAIPHDGSTYEGYSMKDESTGTLWAYENKIPDGFAPMDAEKFNISLGHIFKCHRCHGHGRIKCQNCGGKIRWTTYRPSSKKNIEHVCNCGDGKQDCPKCLGFGQMLKVLRVDTSYKFDEKTANEYSGALPESVFMESSGNVIFKNTSDFENRVIAEAIDGFEPDEFDRLMIDMHSELKREVGEKVARQLTNPNILKNLIDDYFKNLPNPVTANKRLQEEILPVRMKCEVTDVPVKNVKYEYKGNDYSLHIHGNKNEVWVDGKKPVELTWKLTTIIVLSLPIVLWFAGVIP